MTRRHNENDDKEVAYDQARRPRPVTDEMRAEVVRLHAAGLGRNAIARELEVAAGTVTKIAQALELSFDREATAFATRARVLELADARSVLERSFLIRAQEALDAMDAPMVIGQFGGKDNVWNEHLLDEPTVEAKRNLITIAGIGAQRALELAKVGSRNDIADAEGTLDKIGRAARAFADVMVAEDPSNDPTLADDV